MDGVWTSEPRRALAGLALDLSGVRWTGPPQRATEAPVPGTALIVSLEHSWRIGAADGAPLRTRRSFVGGVSLAPAVSEHDGRAHAIQVNLTPVGTAAVLGVPASALAAEVVDLGDLIGDREATLLAERLACEDDWSSRFALFGDWIARRAADAAPLPADVVRALARIEASAGRVRVSALERELRCSRRHLSRRFAEHVGCPPKAYARLVRFRRALDAVRHTRGELGRIAVECGYSDQAHLAREMRELAGATATAIRAAAQVTFVQDASRGTA